MTTLSWVLIEVYTTSIPTLRSSTLHNKTKKEIALANTTTRSLVDHYSITRAALTAEQGPGSRLWRS